MDAVGPTLDWEDVRLFAALADDIAGWVRVALPPEAAQDLVAPLIPLMLQARPKLPRVRAFVEMCEAFIEVWSREGRLPLSVDDARTAIG